MRIKAEHEAWVEQSLAQHMANVGFAELEQVCSQVAVNDLAPSASLTVTYPREKMARNGLTSRVDQLFAVGLQKTGEVGAWIEAESVQDDNFPARLRAGFLAEYDDLRASGASQDEVFEGLAGLAYGGLADMRRMAAGLAVLAHLFEICDLFEQ